MTVIAEVNGQGSDRSAGAEAEREVYTLADAVDLIRKFLVSAKPQLQLLYRGVCLSIVRANIAEIPQPFELQEFRWEESYTSLRFTTLMHSLLENPRVNFSCLCITQERNSPCWLISAEQAQ